MAFQARWRELRREGWSSKRPQGLSVGFTYIMPGQSTKGVRGKDFFVGENELMAILDQLDLAELRQQNSKKPVPNPQVSTACDSLAQTRGKIETVVVTSSTPVRDATEYNDSGPPGSPTELPDKANRTSSEGLTAPPNSQEISLGGDALIATSPHISTASDEDEIPLAQRTLEYDQFGDDDISEEEVVERDEEVVNVVNEGGDEIEPQSEVVVNEPDAVQPLATDDPNLVQPGERTEDFALIQMTTLNMGLCTTTTMTWDQRSLTLL
ncbi:hypothetical protein DVH05_020040 [Phytophthora capsici]|nr:hypothetical protein DVH05_020040 [Phytophthora capsici]